MILPGRLEQTTYPNGTQATYGHDNANRLTIMANQQADSSVISSYAYMLDSIGNPLPETRDELLPPVFTPGTVAYSYDEENRLTEAAGIPNSFDSNGNQTSKGSDTFVYD